MAEANCKSMPEGLGWPVAVTILSFFGSIIGIVVWLFFYAASYNVYQNIAIVSVVVMAFVAAMRAVWAAWGIGQAQKANLS